MAKIEERQQQLEDKLGVSAFLWNQMGQLGVQVGGTALGAFIGSYLGKREDVAKFTGSGITKFLENFNILNRTPSVSRMGRIMAGIAGGVIGLIIGGAGAAYSHWKRSEAQKLAVEEINRDLSTLMAKRLKTEDMLQTQGATIEQLLKDEQARQVHDNDLTFSHREKLEAQADAEHETAPKAIAR